MSEHAFLSVICRDDAKCVVLLIGTLTGGLLCRRSHPLCRLKNPTVVYMITCRLSSFKTDVYNVRLLIILERGCSGMYRKEKAKHATHSWEYLPSTKVHFESMHTRCFHYFKKTRSPSRDFFFKTFQKK